MKNSMKSYIAKAKGPGAAGYGSSHWLYQRLTALFLALSAIWLVIFLYKISLSKELYVIIDILTKPYNIVMSSLFVIAAFYHSYLGMLIIIEDYIHCRSIRLSLIILLQFFSIITVATFIMTIIILTVVYTATP